MKKRHFKHEPLDALRDADPIVAERLPGVGDDPRAQALFEEITSLPIEEEAPSPTRAPKRSWIFQPAWAASAAVALVAGVVGTVALLGGSPSDPPDTQTVPTNQTPPTAAAAPIAGACVEQYDLETLANRDFAFDGTVTSVDGDQVTFLVNQWFRGDQVTEVTLTATGLTGGALTEEGVPLEEEVTSIGGGLTLVDGERFLVAGSDIFVWSCGFTQSYDPAVAADWAAVFEG
ncbi:MAG: hypothetical protein OER12_05200 [Acidimicrobiia bacterium]|nr:hypothetical protein [Acidimicrobiia bacterium]